MSRPTPPVDDLFQPNGRLRLERFTPTAGRALEEAIRLTRKTRWDSIRSPHVFMGLLATPDRAITNWGQRLGVDSTRLLEQFQELFLQDQGSDEAVLVLSREFFSDNVIRLLRDAWQRACSQGRDIITSMDLLISLLTASNSIVAECFERIGVTARKLTELAELAEQQCNQG